MEVHVHVYYCHMHVHTTVLYFGVCHIRIISEHGNAFVAVSNYFIIPVHKYVLPVCSNLHVAARSHHAHGFHEHFCARPPYFMLHNI